jgi:hypothetical protein
MKFYVLTDHAIAAANRLRELRTENGLPMDDFTILMPLTDTFTTADSQRRGCWYHRRPDHAVDVLRRAQRHRSGEGSAPGTPVVSLA